MSTMASQITSLTIVYSTVYSGADQINIKELRHRLCGWNSPVNGEFPTQRTSNAENVSSWWRHHAIRRLLCFHYILSCCELTRCIYSYYTKWLPKIIFAFADIYTLTGGELRHYAVYFNVFHLRGSLKSKLQLQVVSISAFSCFKIFGVELQLCLLLIDLWEM